MTQEYKIKVTHSMNLCIGYLTQVRPVTMVMVGNGGARRIIQLVMCVHSLPVVMRSLLGGAGIDGQISRSQKRIGWSGNCMTLAMPESVKWYRNVWSCFFKNRGQKLGMSWE